MHSTTLTAQPARWAKHASCRQAIDEAIRRHRFGTGNEYYRLIQAVRTNTGLLSSRGANAGRNSGDAMARACQRLAQASGQWLRAPETWRGTHASSLHLVWRELLAHVACEYETPCFLAHTWLAAEQASWHRQLYFHLAMGKSIRKFSMPMVTGKEDALLRSSKDDVGDGRAIGSRLASESRKLTKSEARHFMVAPADCSVQEALRWARIRAMGGTLELARIGMRCLPGAAEYEWSSCWRDVIAFLIRHQPLCTSEVKEIIGFVQQQRFEPARVSVGAWMGNAPVDETFSLRRWSLRRLRRYRASWRDAYPKPSSLDPVPWPSIQWEPFDDVVDGERWTIEELCTSKELRKEGTRMRHCVASYVNRCRRGISSIWSLRKHINGKDYSVVTIDVSPQTKVIREALGRWNSSPTAESLRLITAWTRSNQ